MAKIKLLDDNTINKIAAGEVIERPSSVVKELVENSIDAGARKILIEVMEGGKSKIKITDDGCGMDSEDLPLAFQKHATSKISVVEDLEKISTLGFRGEALSSIASVSRRVDVYTKTQTSISGTHLILIEGKIAEIKEAGCPVGTSITVSDLFYNIPARRKHLKGAEAELAYIAIVISEMAIINYGISFELFSGKRTLFKSIKSSSWDDALLRIYGLNTVKSMSRLSASGSGWSLIGVVGDPLSTRTSSDRIFIFVNGRAVTSRVISSALRDAYRNIIPLGKSPVAVISLNINPELVDVNVHPAKREIRLLHEAEIGSALTKSVAEALQICPSTTNSFPGDVPYHSQLLSKGTIAQSLPQRTLPIVESEDPGAQLASKEKPRLKILGQILDLYIVAEGEQGLVIIDQHAAAERIRFELLVSRYRQKKIKQELAVPITIELSPGEQILISSWQQTLEDIGFEITPFGGNTYSIRAVPALGKRLEDSRVVHDILRDLLMQGKVSPNSTNKDEVLRILACRGSIKSGKKLTFSQMHDLIEKLQDCQNPLTCPHGRPVMVSIDQNHLERLFARR